MNRNIDLTVHAKKENGKIFIRTESSKPHTIRLVNVKATSANNGTMVINGNDTVITPECNTIDVTL